MVNPNLWVALFSDRILIAKFLGNPGNAQISLPKFYNLKSLKAQEHSLIKI